MVWCTKQRGKKVSSGRERPTQGLQPASLGRFMTRPQHCPAICSNRFYYNSKSLEATAAVTRTVFASKRGKFRICNIILSLSKRETSPFVIRTENISYVVYYTFKFHTSILYIPCKKKNGAGEERTKRWLDASMIKWLQLVNYNVQKLFYLLQILFRKR